MTIAAIGFGLFGFIFGLLAYGQVRGLEKRVADLELDSPGSQ